MTVDPFELLDVNDRAAMQARFEAAYTQIGQELEAEWAKIGPTEPPPIVYHYTSPSGLVGIVQSRSIFLTDAFFLNDQSELVYGRDFALSIMRDRLARSGGHEQRFLETALRTFDPFKEGEFEFRYYVSCFCSDGNLLSQWRAYGAPGSGFAVGFESAPLLKLKETTEPGIRAVLHRIEYRRTAQRQLIEWLLDRCIGSLREDLRTAKSELHTNVAMAGWFSAFAVHATGLFAQFKHEMFSEEREWRLTCSRLPYEQKGRLKFRQSARHIIPYIALPLTVEASPYSGRLPIVEIIHAPTGEPQLAKRSVKTLLTENGYTENDVRVLGSGIPLRTG